MTEIPWPLTFDHRPGDGRLKSRRLWSRVVRILVGAMLAIGVVCLPSRCLADDPTRGEAIVPVTVGKDGAFQQTNYALLFATDHYSHSTPLGNPIFDANALATGLKPYGFKVTVVPDPTMVQIVDTLKQYATMRYGEADELLIFFAGHGEWRPDVKNAYIIASDSDVSGLVPGYDFRSLQ